jgi:hypothetical protein
MEGLYLPLYSQCPTELDQFYSIFELLFCRYDIIAQLCHAKRLAEKLHPAARMVELHGAHLVSHERPDEVNILIVNFSKGHVNAYTFLLEQLAACCIL